MAAIIKIENLYKVYPVGKEKVVALGGISLKLRKARSAASWAPPVLASPPCSISWRAWKNRARAVC